MTTDQESGRHRPAILCIDEEQTALTIRTVLLESAGYRVFPAKDANTAMQLFVAHEVDLVLSSHHLRVVSGGELLIFMTQVKPVKVVLLSKVALPAIFLRLVDACLDQDSPAEELLVCLQEVLAKHSKRKVSSALALMVA